MITARRRSLGQGNIFTPVCHSVHGGSTWAGTPHHGTRYIPRIRYTPVSGTPPDQVYPPGTRYTHPPQDQVPPGTRYTLQTRYIPWTRYTPQGPEMSPWTRYTTLTRYSTPPGPGTPHTWYPPGDQVHPRGPGTPTQAVHAGRYRKQVGGTHPTGMHSCLVIILLVWKRSPEPREAL